METPTLVVGIGGIGGDIISRLARRIRREGVSNVELVVMDTDVNDLRRINEKHSDVYTVQTSPKGTVGKALDHNEYARERWFPVDLGLLGKSFNQGAGQVRAVSRLAFDHAVELGLMEDLEKAIAKLHGLDGSTHRSEMRIIITGSIAGGTGSGLVLPVAMYIRNFLITRYQDNSAIIRGFFLEPDVLFGRLVDEEERNTLRANAYAAVREVDAFFRKEYLGTSDAYTHVVFNAPQPGMGKRMDYPPNILPYNFIFLMDALNVNGDSLTDVSGRFDLESYKQHAADCIYAQALSAVSGRSDSSEDNVIRKLASSNGRSRYCGAGSSCLEYPKEAIRRYIALIWAEQNISEEWLEIDTEYNRRVRDEPTLELSCFYRTEYDSKRGSNIPFYKTIMARSERKDKSGEVVDTVAHYVDDLVAHAESWAADGLRRECASLRHFTETQEARLKPLPTSADEIQSQCSEVDDPAGLMQSRIGGFFDAVKRYGGICLEEVPDLSRSFALGAFTVSDFDDDPLVSRAKAWQVESIFHVVDGNESGSFHPAAVRYMLYRLSEMLDEKRCDALEEAEAAKSQMQAAERADYYGETEEVEGAGDAVRVVFFEGEGDGKRRISLPFLKKGGIDDDKAGALANICERLNKYKRQVDRYITSTVTQSFLDAALGYVKNLSAAYEDFYSHLGKEIIRIRSEIASIEHSAAYNDPCGRAHRYVCASTECLKKIQQLCFKKGTSGELSIELCGDIYKSLLRYAKVRSAITDYGERGKMTAEMFGTLFQTVIIEYWLDAVVDPHAGYPDTIDKGIVQAIGDEGIYLSDSIFTDKEAEIAFAQKYVEDTLKEAKQLAAPFVEPPVGEVPRSIDTCAFSEDAFDGAGAYGETVQQLLKNTYNGQQASRKDFSKYEILFYSSLYGFLADNLPKYAPAHIGMEKRPEGEYHRAYFAVVNQLSPNPKDNGVITPHIDRNWHLVSALPDLNEDNERRIKEDIVHSFLFGLIFQQFEAEVVADGDDMYYVKASSRCPRTKLWVSNGTPCDHFFEVYDALKFSPPAVQMLLDRSTRRLNDERNNSLALSIECCKLLERIRSMAFVGYDHDEWAERILTALASLAKGEDTFAAKSVPYSMKNGRLDSVLVTNLFGYGSDEDAPRTSVFEIPLLYRISLPQSDLRDGEIDTMVGSIFSVVERHLENFCEEADLVPNCCQLFEEQYLLFEWNLIGYERVFRNVHANMVVGAIREKVLSYLEQSDMRYDRMSGLQNRLKLAWRRYRDERVGSLR